MIHFRKCLFVLCIISLFFFSAKSSFAYSGTYSVNGSMLNYDVTLSSQDFTNAQNAYNLISASDPENFPTCNATVYQMAFEIWGGNIDNLYPVLLTEYETPPYSVTGTFQTLKDPSYDYYSIANEKHVTGSVDFSTLEGTNFAPPSNVVAWVQLADANESTCDFPYPLATPATDYYYHSEWDLNFAVMKNIPFSSMPITVTSFFADSTTPTPTPTPTEAPTPTPTPTETPTAVITTLTPIADTYLNFYSQNNNEGSAPTLKIENAFHGRILVKFDQSQIQSAIGSSINYTATLQFPITLNGNNWGASGKTIEAHRLTTDWTEGSGYINGNPSPDRGTGSGATWNCSVDTNILNNVRDCSGGSQWDMDNSTNWPFILTSTASSTIVDHQTGTVPFDVTTDVQAFMNGSNDYGWFVKKTDETVPGKVYFGSRETNDTPTLVITAE